MADQDLTLTVRGAVIADRTLRRALGRLSGPFDRAAFAAALAAEGAPKDAELPRQALQRLKRKGVIAYDASAKRWSVIGKAPPIPSPAARVSPAATAADATKTAAPITPPIPAPPHAPAPQPPSPPRPQQQPPARPSLIRRFVEALRFAVAALACFTAVGALAAINAGFAWEMVDAEVLRIALTLGLLAGDALRPLAMAQGMIDFERGRWRRGLLAVFLALSLAPASVLSTTTVVSAALSLGVAQNAATAVVQEDRAALRAEHQRLQRLAQVQWSQWGAECARGGCGERAAVLATQAGASERAAQEALAQSRALSAETAQDSSFSARAAAALDALGLIGDGRGMIIPLLIALTLECAALLGPAVLLTASRPRRIKPATP